MVEKLLADLEIEMRAVAVARKGLGQRLAQVLGQDGAGAGIDKEGLGGDAFGIDDLVVVEEKLEVIYKAAILALHGVAIHEIARAHQQFGPPGAERIRALVDEEPVIGADQQV